MVGEIKLRLQVENGLLGRPARGVLVMRADLQREACRGQGLTRDASSDRLRRYASSQRAGLTVTPACTELLC